VRYLHFGSELVQGAMRIARPWSLELEYTRDLMLPLVLADRAPASVLQLGLGAASITRYLHHHFPATRLTVVEIDPRVIATARQCFRLPQESAHLRIVEGEAHAFVAGAKARFDLIVMDAFDDKGRFLRDEQAEWSLEGLKGTVAAGTFTVSNDPIDQAGLIKASVGSLSGQARARVVRPMPWKETFDSFADGAAPAGWVNTTAGKISVATLDGQKVLQKVPDDTIFKRVRAFIGPATLSDYTFEADVRAGTRRRQVGDIGITAQRYSLVLYGNSQKLKIEPWEPETARTVTVPFAWKPDTWYRLKLRVENLPGGQVRAQGKAWAVGEAEPPAWTIEKVDPIGNRQGAPGLFIDAQFGVYLDNLSLTKN